MGEPPGAGSMTLGRSEHMTREQAALKNQRVEAGRKGHGSRERRGGAGN
jgi:hypothetical protein